MEKRFQLTEVRAVKNGDKRTITGYAARYKVLSGDLGGFRNASRRVHSSASSPLSRMLFACSTILTVRFLGAPPLEHFA
jgi:hypothetical protein